MSKIKTSISAGISMIEILIVIAIIALLAALLFPVIIRAKSYSKTVPCESNLHQLSVAWHTYLGQYDDQRPKDIVSLMAVVPSIKKIMICPMDTTRHGNEGVYYEYKFKESYYYLQDIRGMVAKMDAVDPNHGIFVCYAHGTPVRFSSPEADPSTNWYGLTLRLLIDGSVQHAQVPMFCGPTGSHMVGKQIWASYTDVPCKGEMCLDLPNHCPASDY